MKHEKAEKPSVIPLPLATHSSENPRQPVYPSPLVVVGSAAMDITSRVCKQPGTETAHSFHSTAPGSVSFSPGGVGRNITEAAHRILSKKPGCLTPLLVSLVGGGIMGRVLQDEISRMGMRTEGLILNPGTTPAVCNMVLDAGGGLITGVADMHITELLEGTTVNLFIFYRPIALSTLSAHRLLNGWNSTTRIWLR